jgi:NAD(P)-dependent dehydrogenase (short-subunit alcohol dehydrogenase family)
VRTVVVTGASTGIGQATVLYLLRLGFRVFGGVRRDSDALPFQAFPHFHPLIFDVTDPAVVEAAVAQVSSMLGGSTLTGLVNNAGIAVAGPVLHLALEDFRRQIDVNLTGVFVVTKAFLPLLGCGRTTGSPGRIVNISSVSGQIGWPMLGAYCASKHGLEGLSESLRRELAPFGIEVSIVGPGVVKTPIWRKSEDLSRFVGTPYESPLARLRELMNESERRGMEPEQVAGVIHRALTERCPKARYAVVRSWLWDVALPLWLPKRIVDREIARRLGLRGNGVRSGSDPISR